MRELIFSVIFLLFAGLGSVSAQNRILSGKVLDGESGNPLEGVTVYIKGIALGTVTNNEGDFRIEIPDKAQTLVFSFVGMKSQELPVSSTSFNITLLPDYIGLREIIATGYSNVEKIESTGSSYQIAGNKIAGIPVTSVDQSLQGKVPGLVVSATSGTPGSVQDIRIRGVSSITASNNPLFVIDGVPVVNPNFTGETMRSSFSALSFLKPEDIESVSVLKDASATSAYGARGANGVVVITTKKGNSGKTVFSAGSYVGFQNNATDGFKVLTGAQREELMLEAIHNSKNIPISDSYSYLIDNKITNSLKNWVELYNRKEGNWTELLKNKNALVQNYDLSASGGDVKTTYFASLGYNNTEATVVGGEFQRISGKFNFQHLFNSKVKFALNMIVSNTIQDAYLEQSAYFGNPQFTKYLMSPWEQPYLSDGETLNTNLTTSAYNTLYTLENDIAQNNLTRGMVNSFIEWHILNNLVFKTLYEGDYNVAAFHGYQNRVHGDGKLKGGSALQSVMRNYNWVTQNSLNYLLKVDKNILDFKILLEYQENNNNLLSGSGEKFPADGLFYLSSASSNLDANAEFTNWKNMSYLGLLNYNYSNKYIAQFTYRYEGSSVFAPEHRFGSFWSVGAAWNINEEIFMQDFKFIDFLRLRASYGLSGNSAIGLNQYQDLLKYDKSYAGAGAVYPAQFGNPDLTWEKNKNYDLGADYSFFNGRLKGSFSTYKRNSYDLLQLVPLSRTTGQISMMENVGSMTNKGFEAFLQVDVIRKGDFKINLGLNFATVRNEVTELAKDAEGNDINIEDNWRKVAVGHPVYGWYMRKWAGVNPENGNSQWYINGKDGEVTENYYAAQKDWQGGSAIPKFTAGLLTHAEFKGFFADADFYFAGGHKIYEDFSFTLFNGFYSLFFYNGSQQLMNRWQQPGDITDVPKVLYGTTNDTRESTRFLMDGNYMRIKDLVFGYNLPSKLNEKIGCDNITLSVRGTNLFTTVKDNRLVFDPEVGADGLTRLTTPPVKSIVFAINLNF